MENHGEVIAILNDELVLVRANEPSVFRPGKRFKVFEIVDLDPARRPSRKMCWVSWVPRPYC